MLHLWKNRESIEISESFHSYLMTSVRNRCLNRLRKTDLYCPTQVSATAL